MPIELATLAAGVMFNYVAIISPLVQDLGSFIAGSAAFSNMMFAGLQKSIAAGAGLNQRVLLGLQMIGANAENRICVVNVVAPAWVVNLIGKEGQRIRFTLVPILYSSFYSGLMALIFLAYSANRQLHINECNQASRGNIHTVLQSDSLGINPVNDLDNSGLHRFILTNIIEAGKFFNHRLSILLLDKAHFDFSG